MIVEISGIRGKLDPLHGRIMVSDFESGRRKVGSIIVPDDNGLDRGIRPRWARVVAIGDDVEDVSVGEWVLVEHGRWTWGITVTDEDGEKRKLHGIDPKSILLAGDKPLEG